MQYFCTDEWAGLCKKSMRRTFEEFRLKYGLQMADWCSDERLENHVNAFRKHAKAGFPHDETRRDESWCGLFDPVAYAKFLDSKFDEPFRTTMSLPTELEKLNPDIFVMNLFSRKPGQFVIL
jgi:hypothetical protein